MFYGQYEHTLDGKGRVIVPSRIRQVLSERFSEKFMATRGLEKCISLYTMEGWNGIVEKTRALPVMTGRNARAFTRLLFSGASECTLDRQGRILLPRELRDYAEINRDIVIVGVSDHIEIWGREKWTEYVGKEGEAFEKTAEELMEFGI